MLSALFKWLVNAPVKLSTAARGDSSQAAWTSSQPAEPRPAQECQEARELASPQQAYAQSPPRDTGSSTLRRSQAQALRAEEREIISGFAVTRPRFKSLFGYLVAI